MNVLENHSLQPLNTFGLDVKARWYAEVFSIADLQFILSDLRFKSTPKLVLGGGSNILFTGDFDGLVIHNRIEGISIVSEDENEVIVRAGAGVNWHQFVLFTIEHNFPGLENLSLIPGCVGAAPIQNIGAYGVEIKKTFEELNAVKMDDGTIHNFSLEECRFGYRDSIFKREAKNKYAIVDVTFRFYKKDKLNTTYGAIEEQLKLMHVVNPNIRDVSKAVIAIRQSKLPDPAVIGNAGSFFKNPEISLHQFNELKNKYPGIVGYPSKDQMKIAAGWLIEHSGWKGKQIGHVGMHEKQALVLVNHQGATGKELINHAERVQADIFQKFGIMLEMEVNII